MNDLPVRDPEPEPGAKWADDVDRPPRRITDRQLWPILRGLGILRAGDYVSRVIVDIRAHDVVRIYVERYGDERLLQLARSLDGAEITTTAELHDQERRDAVETMVKKGLDPDVARRLAFGGA